MREIFVTHKHVDHLMGIVWMIRMICQYMRQGQYQGEAWIYGHDEVTAILSELADKLLSSKDTRFIGKRLHMETVSDGEERLLLGRKTTFFDIRSTKAKQYGFCMDIGGGDKLTCCGDEPCSPFTESYARGSKWLLHEAFCLDSEAERYAPYEKHHSTVKDACTAAEQLHVDNLVLYHTEDSDIRSRKARYTAEGKQYYSGNLYVPDDLETIDIS